MELHIVLDQSKANKAKIENRYNQVLHMTKDMVWECDKNTRKHHIQGSQEVSLFRTGDHKATRNTHDRQNIINPA